MDFRLFFHYYDNYLKLFEICQRSFRKMPNVINIWNIKRKPIQQSYLTKCILHEISMLWWYNLEQSPNDAPCKTHRNGFSVGPGCDKANIWLKGKFRKGAKQASCHKPSPSSQHLCFQQGLLLLQQHSATQQLRSGLQSGTSAEEVMLKGDAQSCYMTTASSQYLGTISLSWCALSLIAFLAFWGLLPFANWERPF